MHMREVARRLSVSEFTTICSWLDVHYGKEACRFEVLEIMRTSSGILTSVKLMLGETKRVLMITPEMIDKMAAEVKREMRDRARDSSA